VEVAFENDQQSVRVSWVVVLLERSNYLRQVLTIAVLGEREVPISRVELIDLNLRDAQVIGQWSRTGMTGRRRQSGRVTIREF
jgi:hypothetical protein